MDFRRSFERRCALVIKTLFGDRFEDLELLVFMETMILDSMVIDDKII